LSYEGKTSDDHFNWFLNYTHGRLVNQAEGYYSTNWPEINWIGGNYTDLDQIQAQFSYDSLDYVALTTGIDYYKYDVETYGYSATKGSITDLGIYVLGKIRLLDSRLIFTVGGRYDSYKLSSINVESRTEDKFVPSVGVAYSPFDFIKFRANYSVGYAVPSPQQLLGDGADQYLAAPDLKPQESKTWEVGVDISYDFIDASLTYFHSIFKDKIISRTYYGNSACQQSPCYQFINLDEAVQAGIEFSLKFDIGKALNQEFSLAPYVSATWMTKRENKDPDDVVSIDPDVLPNMPRLMLSYGITFDYPDQNLSARLNATYFGKFYTQNWDDGTWAGPWVEYGGFTSVDFSISKRILDFQDKGNVELKVDVNNMFNQYKGPTLNYPIQARNFYVGLVYNY
jgi:vitamin B12 transporter